MTASGHGKGKYFSIWPLVWHHLVDTPSSRKYVEAFQKYGKLRTTNPGATQLRLKIIAQSINEIQSAGTPQKLAEHLRKGAKFDVMKAREFLFPPL